jgi:hypothetical protein
VNRNHCLRLSCPACGPFGIKARRRARRASEDALVAFWEHQATIARAERRASWDDLLAEMETAR